MQNKSVLLSAYACEPNKGSESEVGWLWVLEIAKKTANVVVVTRKKNRFNIEEALKDKAIKNIEFSYFDLPYFLSFYKKGKRFINLYTYLWEVGVFFHLLFRYKKNTFDISQRITFVSYKFPSFLWFFSKYFIFGPVAGGERYPTSLLSIFSIKGKFREIFRIVFQRLAFIDPFVLLTLQKANQIITTTNETKSILPKFFHKKTIVKQAVAINKLDFKYINKKKNFSKDKLNLLYVGRLLEWKGILFVLKALKSLKSRYIFTIVGSGPDMNFFKNYVEKNQLNVLFIDHCERSSLSRYYFEADLFLYLSLHDSGGMSVLEAKAHDLPVVVTSFGGPKNLVDNNDFIVDGTDEKTIISNLLKILSSKKFLNN